MPESKINLLFLNQTLGIGGAETWFAGLFKWLDSHGANIQVYTTNKRFEDQLSFVTTRHIPIVVDLIGDWKGFLKGLVLLPFAIIYYGCIVFQFRKTHVLFLSGFIERVIGSLWGKLYRVPVVWIEHGPYGRLMTQFGGLAKKLYASATRTPRTIIVPSRHTAKWLINQFPDTKSKIRVIANALETGLLKSSVKPTTHLVVCVSRLEKGKGQDVLINSWAKVVAEVPKAKLIIVGEGSEYEPLQKKVQNLNLEDSVRLTGWVNSVSKYVARSEFVVFPSVWELEGFGMVAIEAMSHSKAVVGFDYGPVPEIIDNSCGILVSPNNQELLAKAIIRLLTHKELAAELGRSGRLKFEKRFTFNTIGPEYLRVFQKACQKN